MVLVEIAPGRPALRALTATRLRATLPSHWAIDDRSPAEAAPLVVVRIDADVVADPGALVAATERAVGAGRPLHLLATPPDRGTPTRCGTISVAGTLPDDSDASVAAGVRILAAPVTTGQPSGRPLRVFAPALGISGYACGARNLMLGMQSLGVDVRWECEWGDTRAELVDRSDGEALLALSRGASLHDPTLLYRPAGYADGAPFFSSYRARRARGPVIAYTMFETDALPPRWRAALAESEAVWVPSSFNAETFAAAGVPRERIAVVPIGIPAWRYDPDGDRGQLVNARGRSFFAAFEWSARKGADVLLRAWSRAFAPDDDVTLYLRTGSDAATAQHALAEALAATGLRRCDLAPIVLLHEALDEAALRAVMRAVDAFVLTSRGEGFCIPMLEAMCLGKPVIGTGWGGSSDFFDASTGFPIPARLVPVDERFARELPLYRGQRWADPDVDATAEALQAVARGGEDVQRRAAAAFARAHTRFDRLTTARVAADALATLPERRTSFVQGAAIVYGSSTSDSDSGAATRMLVTQLAQARREVSLVDRVATVRVTPDARVTRALGAARRRSLSLPRPARIAVDRTDRDAEILYCTHEPSAGAALERYAQIWVVDDPLRALLIARGVDPAVLRVVPLVADPDLWSPDLAFVRPDDDAFALLAFEWDPQWSAALARTLLAVTTTSAIGVTIFADDVAPPRGDAVVRQLNAALAKVPAATLARCSFALRPWPSTELDRGRVLGRHDAASVSSALSPRWHAILEAHGVPRLGDDSELARAVAASPLARWRASRASRTSALGAWDRARDVVAEAVAEVSPLLAPRLVAESSPRVFIAPGHAASDEDVAAARALATFSADDPTLATHLAVVDGGVRPGYGWDAFLVDALDAHPECAVAAGSRVVSEIPNDPGRSLFLGGILNHQDSGVAHGAGPAGIGVRLVAADERRSGPLWIASDCLFRTLGAQAVGAR